jgi:septum site-determining protein MinD
MGKVCSFVSVKGGTGKTTTAVNAGLSLAKEGFDVLLIDANVEGSNLSFHLGLSTYDISTIHDIFNNKCSALEAVYDHPSGLHLILGSSHVNDINTKAFNLEKLVSQVKSLFDFIIIDCSSGFNDIVKESISTADEVVIVTNPELPAVVDAFKLVQHCENTNSFIRGVVINKADSKSELSKNDVEVLLNRPIIGVVPEDREIKEAVKARTPIVSLNPKTKSAKELKRVGFAVGELHSSEKNGLLKRFLDFFS